MLTPHDYRLDAIYSAGDQLRLGAKAPKLPGITIRKSAFRFYYFRMLATGIISLPIIILERHYRGLGASVF